MAIKTYILFEDDSLYNVLGVYTDGLLAEIALDEELELNDHAVLMECSPVKKR